MADFALPMGPDEIMRVLPHRPPFLLVDRVLEIDLQEGRVVGEKHVRDDEWYLSGHFPDYPVMPGVLVLEAIAQVGAVLILASDEHRGKTPLFAGADRVRFRQQVRPGDTMRIESKILKFRRDIGWATGMAFVDGKQVATADIIFALKAIGE